jgi:ketosteroid isomerase-like protein
MSEQDNTRIIQEAFGAFGRGDLPGLLAMLTEDVTWDHPQPGAIPWAGARRGRDQVAEYFRLLGGTGDVLAFEPRQFVAQGDTVVVLGSERIRVRATEREYAVEWVLAFTLRDGKIASFREYTDTAAIIAALRRDG